MPPLRRLAFVVNEQKAGASALAQTLAATAASAGAAVRVASHAAIPLGYLDAQDACCVIGGDGTLLGVASPAARAGVPVIGVNCGSLGFLTTYSADEARAQFAGLLAGAYQLTPRSMLACTIGPGEPHLALNDVLIKHEVNSSLVRLEVFAGDELVTDYSCDGLILSTPTGSTAYNLSAGGPLIHPGAAVIAMTPICPHTLSNRSIIFSQDIRLRVHNCSSSTRLMVAIDGQRNLPVNPQAPVEITIAGPRLQLVQRLDYSHFAVVRAKLKWSGGAAERA